MLKDPTTGATTFWYKGESVVFSEQELIGLMEQGLSAEQIKQRVISTLQKAVERKHVVHDFAPF